MAHPDKNAESSWMTTLASIAVVIAALYLAKGVLVPFTLAVLLSFLLSPLCDWLERRRLGRIPAVLVTAALGFTVLGIVFWTAVVQMTHFAPRIPEYRQNIEAKLNSVNEYAVVALSQLTTSVQGIGHDLSPVNQSSAPRGTDELPFSVRVLSSPISPLQIFGGMFGTLIEVLGTTGIVIVLVVFFLLRREDLRDRFIHLVGGGHVTVTTQMLEDAGARVSRYLAILCLLNVAFGMSIASGLYVIGVPNAVLWGILAGILRFIPYIGPWIAAVIPIGLSMAIATGWGATVLTLSLFVVLELFNNNVLEPWLYGKKTGVSAVAVMLAAVFWTWLWGPVGLLLATPLTVCVFVVGKHIPELSFLDILLGTEPVFEPKTRIYQRLLAGDQEEAAELFDEYLAQGTVVEFYDTALIPALAMAETHSQLGDLKEGRYKFMMSCLREMIQDYGDRQQEKRTVKGDSTASELAGDVGRADGTSNLPLEILCLPARNEADELTAMMLAQVVEATDCRVQVISVDALGGQLEQHAADVICITATPPAAVMHARYVCKRLRARLPHAKLLVGLWDTLVDLDKARERIGYNAIVVNRLADAQEQIRLLSRSNSATHQESLPTETPPPRER